MKRMLTSLLAAAYTLTMFYVGGAEFERGSMATVMAMLYAPGAFAFVFFFPAWPVDGRDKGSCRWCGSRRPTTPDADGGPRLIGLERLKRIPPLSELEGVKTDEPIKEPA